MIKMQSILYVQRQFRCKACVCVLKCF